MIAGVYNNVQIDVTGKIIAVGNYVPSRGKISYFDLTGALISIATTSDGTNNFVHINPTTVTGDLNTFDNGGANDGHLRYMGGQPKFFQIEATISISPIVDFNTFIFALAKNETILSSSKVLFRSRTSTDIDVITIHDTIELVQGDEICISVANTTSNADITVKSLMLMVNE
jgi:hypothetical protein